MYKVVQNNNGKANCYNMRLAPTPTHGECNVWCYYCALLLLYDLVLIHFVFLLPGIAAVMYYLVLMHCVLLLKCIVGYLLMYGLVF